MELTNEKIQQLVLADMKRKEYRDAYNQRPEVKAKRAEYMKKRNAEMRELMRLFKAGKLGGTRVDMSGNMNDGSMEAEA